jgi:hypothetical protein
VQEDVKTLYNLLNNNNNNNNKVFRYFPSHLFFTLDVVSCWMKQIFAKYNHDKVAYKKKWLIFAVIQSVFKKKVQAKFCDE